MRENNEWDHQFVFSTTFEVISLELIKYSFILSYDHLQFALLKFLLKILLYVKWLSTWKSTGEILSFFRLRFAWYS